MNEIGNESACMHRNLGVVDFCFICEFPLLHTWDSGRTFNSGGFSDQDAEWILTKSIGHSGGYIETGAGLSTLLFLSAGFEVTSYVNDQQVVGRIRKEMQKFRGERNWRPEIGLSGDLLPHEHHKFRVALIDGGHGFPVPFVDFYFIYRSLSVGSIIFVDDAQLYAPRELILNLFENESLFGLIGISPSSKTYAFEKKTDQTYLPDFGGLVRDKRLMYQGEGINRDLKSLSLQLSSRLAKSNKGDQRRKRWPRII